MTTPDLRASLALVLREWMETMPQQGTPGLLDRLLPVVERLCGEARAAEREACATLVETARWPVICSDVMVRLRSAIRARGDQ